ncbi:ABC transporter substrate-binding protein [Paenibacillus sp. Soil787]|uniref:ABC transporter substrate-binding protein n=1 Tax=Paenibacillus sp. Soil787 TaxID=1736411 RepID=UPI00070174B0|nr:sugar ABC transporter substrate-binding protein [Paenibacillus sp. Soil787]KRF38049.1 hypothetical protein ASG93_25230 [Paenibacillus sp. Soil787]
MKKWLLSACAIMIGASLSGCSNSSSTTAANTKSTDQKSQQSDKNTDQSANNNTKGDKKNLVVWTFANTHTKYYEDVKKQFESEHPDVNVDIKLLEYGALYDKYTVVTKSGGKDAPDLIDVEQSAFARYINGSVPFEPLDSYLQKNKLTDAIPKGRQALYTVDGKPYGIEIAACVSALYYRKDIYDKAGIDVSKIKTWDEFMEASKKLTGKDKFIFSGTLKDQGTFEMLLRQEGGDIVTADGKIGFNTSEGVSVLKRIRAWKDAGIMDKSSPDGPQLWEAFKKDKYIAGFGADWWAGFLLQYAPELSGKWAAVPMPLGGPNSVPTTVAGGTGMAISKFSKNKDLAWEFLKLTHLDTKEVVKSFQIINLFPALMSAASDPILHAKSKMTEYFGGQDLAELYGNLIPKAPNQNQAWWRPLVTKAWEKYEPDYQKGKISPEDFLANVAKETQNSMDAEKSRQN